MATQAKPPEKDQKIQSIELPKEPGAQRFTMHAVLTTNFDQIEKKLSSIPGCTTKKINNKIYLLQVISRDINKRPMVFSLIEFDKKEIVVNYSYAPGTSPKKRFFEVLSFVLNVLTLLKNDYTVDLIEISQIVSRVLDELEDYVNLNYEVLYSMYDSLNTELIKTQKELKQLKEANEQLSMENYMLKTKNNELKAKLDKLLSLPDDVLKKKIQEWIIEHNGEIDIVEFAKVYNLHEGRVEQMLNKMVSEGYLEVK